MAFRWREYYANGALRSDKRKVGVIKRDHTGLGVLVGLDGGKLLWVPHTRLRELTLNEKMAARMGFLT